MRRLIFIVSALSLAVVCQAALGATQTPVTSITRGSMVVSGNVLTIDSPLTVSGGKVYAGDIQVWPAVPRDGHVDPSVTVDQMTQHVFDVNKEVRTQIASMKTEGVLKGRLADVTAAVYRQHTDVVDTSWVDSKSGLPWVKWWNGISEEIQIDDPCGSVGPVKDLATSVAEIWNWAVKNNCTIYTGEGYSLVAPPQPQRAEQMKRNLALVLEGGAAAESVSTLFKRRNALLIRDLRDPQPLGTLRTRR